MLDDAALWRKARHQVGDCESSPPCNPPGLVGRNCFECAFALRLVEAFHAVADEARREGLYQAAGAICPACAKGWPIKRVQILHKDYEHGDPPEFVWDHQIPDEPGRLRECRAAEITELIRARGQENPDA